MSKWVSILLLLVLSIPEPDNGVLFYRPPGGDSGVFSVLENDDAAFHGDAILRSANDGVRVCRLRLPNGSFKKIFSVLKSPASIPACYLQGPLPAERRDDLSPGMCPRLRGYALVFTVT